MLANYGDDGVFLCLPTDSEDIFGLPYTFNTFWSDRSDRSDRTVRSDRSGFLDWHTGARINWEACSGLTVLYNAVFGAEIEFLHHLWQSDAAQYDGVALLGVRHHY